MKHSTAHISTVLGIDPRSLALFRIFLASAILIDIYSIARYLPDFYLDSGIMPRYLLNLEQYSHVPYFHLFVNWDSPIITALGLGLLALFALLLLIGYATRIATIGCWLLVVSLQIRNPHILQSGDNLIKVLLFWAIFLPLDLRFSITALRQKFLDHRPVFSAASVAIYVQFIMIYYISALYKLREEKWWDGTYIQNTLVRIDFVNDFGIFLSQFPELTRILTYGSILLEVVGPFLLFIPIYFGIVRTLVVASFIAFQLGLSISMVLGLFPLISITATIPFIPAWLWDKLKRSDSTEPSKVAPFDTKPYQSGLKYNIVWQPIVSILILLVIVQCYSGYYKNTAITKPMKRVLDIFGINQHWLMFDRAADITFVIIAQAKLSDGSAIDLGNGKRITPELPKTPKEHYGYYRWRKYARDLYKENLKKLRRPYLEYLKRRYYASSAPDAPTIRSIELLAVGYKIVPDPQPSRKFVQRLDYWEP